MRPKLLTVVLVALIAAGVWCSARVRVSPPAPSDPDSLPLGSPVDAEAPGDVRLIDARACARRVVGRELLAGRLTVPEAAAVFGWLDRQHPALPASMIETANLAMAGGTPVGSELSAGARHEAEWLCLRTAGYARNLAWGECLERAEALSEALDDGLLRAWESGKARSLPAVDEDGCRTLLLRAREVPLGTPQSKHPIDVTDLRLVHRK